MPAKAGWLAAPALLALLIAGTPVHAAFKCVDEKGVTHYGDPLPPQCSTKAFTELSSQGTVKGKMDRPLTPEELKARQDDEVRFKDERRKEAEQSRRDRALIATYGAEKEIDFSRDRAIEQVKARWKSAEARLKDTEEKLAKLNERVEFIKSGKGARKDAPAPEIPVHLQQEVDQTKADQAALTLSMTKMEEEIKSLTAQYETDKQRWKDLKSGKLVLQADPKTVGAQKK